MRVELHCHSTCSDGSDTAAVVGSLARERGVELFSLTDHDTCAGYGAAAAAATAGTALRGVEISCEADGHNVHILAFDGGGDWDALEALLAGMHERRQQRLRVIGQQLGRRGIQLDIESIIAEAGSRTVGRPDLAKAMVAQGIVATTKDAFTRYLHDGGPGDAGGHRLHIGDVLATGRAAGAKLALAHPHLLGERAAPLLRRHRADGLDGIEAHYGAYDSAQRSRWARLATELELVCTAGSDRHTDGDPELGIDLDPPATDRLLRWLGR